MDTHETTVRLPDLRQRFDSARQGQPLNDLGHPYAHLVAAESPPEDGRQEAVHGSSSDATIGDDISTADAH